MKPVWFHGLFQPHGQSLVLELSVTCSHFLMLASGAQPFILPSLFKSGFLPSGKPHTRTPPSWDLACIPGMCPAWESNWQPFDLQAGPNPLSHTSQGLIKIPFLKNLFIYFYSVKIVCIFSPSLHPTPATATSLLHLYTPP